MKFKTFAKGFIILLLFPIRAIEILSCMFDLISMNEKEKMENIKKWKKTKD